MKRCNCCRSKNAVATFKVAAFDGDTNAQHADLCADCRDGMKHAKVTRV